MQSTPIKINKTPGNQNEPAKNILNLNDSLASSQANRSGQRKPNNNIKKYLWLLLALVLIEAGGLVWLYLAKPISPYFNLLPSNAIVSSYFNQDSLAALLKSNPNRPLISQGSDGLKTWLAKAKIEQPEQILNLFASQMALAVKPDSTWLLLATIKVPADTFQQTRDKADQALKQNYNLISESYRQVTITQIKPLNQEEGSIFYAEARGYFIMSNSSEIMKATLNKIIK